MSYSESELLRWSEKVPKVKHVQNIAFIWNYTFIVTKILLLALGKFFISNDLGILVSKLLANGLGSQLFSALYPTNGCIIISLYTILKATEKYSMTDTNKIKETADETINCSTSIGSSESETF